ncbi:zinc-binding alcohol dehydrogenase family protein [Actinospica durhamensis]|uniref:Zinc-binding alcohol dehydrogenase family protein n=1 Tax=Actinospica durhamensis TaxID=1508375 RepID=A0A941ISL8_9ACTN|nr:zinc-binding alcohol dehydrogenase family protein [Actinospica durhamensis]MBR7836517.1 zinc-binding alcohol dehydrogenase family protein [Actinospica durhamensis]
MKAAVLRQADGVPEYGEFDEPGTGADGELELVELVAAGLHHLVRSRAHGRHYSSSNVYPLVPGVDAVARKQDGTLVYTGDPQPPHGTMAERIAVSPRMQFALPEGAEARAPEVAAGMNPGMSSWLPLRAKQGFAPLTDAPAELGVVAIVGATGTSGLMAVQNARALGARRVIAVGRNAQAFERARGHGATTAHLAEDREATVRSVLEALDGDTPDLVLDYVWGAPAEAMFAALSGRQQADEEIEYVQIGALAGMEAALPATLLRSRRIRVRGSGLGSVSRARSGS